MRRAGRISRSILVTAGAIVLLLLAYVRLSPRADHARISALEEERAELLAVVQRLSASRRVAQVSVLKESPGEHGWPVKRLLWQEIGDDGLISEPSYVDVEGDVVYFEALVIKFDHRLVAESDASRERSVALFRRIFGDRQAPASLPEIRRIDVWPLESLEGPPDPEAQLWARFWDLVESPALAREFGVRVAQCEAPGVPMKAGEVWEVSLDTAGGLNLKKIFDRGQMANRQPP